jgi:hypothetical protein
MSDSDTTPDRIDDELRPHLARAFGFEDQPATYEAFWEPMLRTFADALGRGLTLEDLCTTDSSPHWATVRGETRYYRCVTDAYLLGILLDEPVTARTVSPVSGTELVVEFDTDGAVSTPAGAVHSFGVDRAVDAPDGPITPETMYGRLCPYSKAFASRAEYDRWAAAHPEVASDAIPLDESLAVQARLLGDTTAPHPDRSAAQSDGDCSC